MENKSTDFDDEKTSFECLSSEMIMSIFDYLGKIEILVSFFHLNHRFRSIIFNYLHSDDRLTQFNLNHTNYSLYQRFIREILPGFQSTITEFELGSSYHYGQIEEFQHFHLIRLDSLTIHLIDSKRILEILEEFLRFNHLSWFDKIHLIIDEETQGWNEKQIFCVQNIPVRDLKITGKVPYVFAQHLMTACYPIRHLTIHLKYDHDLLPLLYYLPNLTECNASVDDRGRDISNDLSLLAPLPLLKVFKYEGVMPPNHLRRLILEINQSIEYLSICTQDYQWPFQINEGFSSDFFDRLSNLKNFHFYIRLITSDLSKKIKSYLNETKYLLDRQFCSNIAGVFSKDIGQIFSVPFAFDHFEIFEQEFFDQIQFTKTSDENSWSHVEYLTIHTNIYDPYLLKCIHENFPQLKTIDYRVPHFSLIPQDHQLHQYDLQLNRIRKLIIRDSVKHGCHVPQPLVLLTPRLVELDIDHFYLMQILSFVSEQTQSNCLKIFAQLRRLTVRQFDERLPKSFFSSFPQIKILILIFTPYKMQIYRAKLPFLDELLASMPHLISLKFAHVKKPQDHLAYLELQHATKQRLKEYFSHQTFWCRWYDDHTQRYHQYATFLCSI